MSSDQSLNAINRALNEVVAKCFPELIRKSARYKYYQAKNGDRYFYTVERINCGCKQMPQRGHYVAGKYRFIKSKRQYKLVKKVCFSKKSKAIDWAEQKAYPNED